jgi:hypothetical protein
MDLIENFRSNEFRETVESFVPFEIFYKGQSAHVWDIVGTKKGLSWIIYYADGVTPVCTTLASFISQVASKLGVNGASKDAYNHVRYIPANSTEEEKINKLAPLHPKFRTRFLTREAEHYPQKLDLPKPDIIEERIDISSRRNNRYKCL